MVPGVTFLDRPVDKYHSRVILRIMSNAIRDLAPKMPTKYLRDFFSEKEIPEVTWDLEDKGGTPHHMPNTVVVEHITKCSPNEALQIGDVLRQIDFANGDVNHFFKHLAGAIINR
jgi:hypothetical protein